MTRLSDVKAGPRCVRGQGLGIADARALRIDVADGALRVHRPDRPPDTVGTVGDLTSAVWLDPRQTRRVLGPAAPVRWFEALAHTFPRPGIGGLADQLDQWRGGSVVISGAGEVALSFHVDSFTPWGGDQAHKREASGAAGLARALGLTLEVASDSDLPERSGARAKLVEPQRQATPVASAALALTVAAGVLAFLSMPFGESGAGLLSSLAALLCIAPVLGLLIRCRRRFERLVSSAPSSDGRTVYRPPAQAIGLLNTHLQFGERDVVLVDAGGREWWLPGPATGGVTTCAVGAPQSALLDEAGNPLLAVRTAQVVPDEAARDKLSDAAGSTGIRVTGHYLGDTTPLDLRYESAEPGQTFTEWERGRISAVVDVLLPLGGALHLGGAIILSGALAPWGYVAPAGSAVWLGIRIWSGLRYRNWRSDVRSRAVAVAPERETR